MGAPAVVVPELVVPELTVAAEVVKENSLLTDSGEPAETTR